MSIQQQPDALSLSMNLKPLIVQATAETVSFTLRKNGEALLSQSYQADKNGRVQIDLRQIVHDSLGTMLSDAGDVYVQTDLAADFTASVDMDSVNFRAVRGGVDRPADSATNFLTQNFLTWQPNVKPVTYYSPEFLTYYAVVAGTARLRAYFTDDSGKVTSQSDHAIADLSSGIAYTIPLQYAVVAGWLGNRLPAYYDVWVEDVSGQRLTYIQRYYAENMKSEQEQWILFENSLGGIDTFRAYGTTVFNGEHTHNIAEVDENLVEYRVDTERKFQKNTGHLNDDERKWLLDFFPSNGKYIYTGNYLRRIIVTDSNVSYTDRELPSNYTFTFRHADARPLLNLSRTDIPADVLDITVPEVGSFTVPPRLAEFSRLPLSGGVLFPVQHPYSEEWGTTTIDSIADYVAIKLETDAGGGGGVGHTHRNMDLLNMFSTADNYLLIGGRKINAGYADKAGSIDGLDDKLEAVLDKCIRKDRPDSTLYPVDFTAGLSINSKRIGDIIRYYDDDKPVATDANIYSALQTDQRIEEAITDGFDDKYLRKDKEDTAHKRITFEEGITVYDLAELMNLDVKNLATIAKAVVSILRSSKFVDGFSGEGYQIWQDIANGDWCMTLDRLTVRKVLTIYELVLQKIRSVGGMVVVSAANGKVKSVERIGNNYLFTFEDTNQFQANDLMRCQVFSPSGLKHYWVKVASVSGESVIVPLSEFEGVVPAAGDECVLMGNTADKRRQNLILISATEDGQPRFDCLDGVRSKSLEGCLKVRVGSLDGISDSRFPEDMQPSGYGLYGNNCFLTGIFVLSNGKDVMTMFSIMEGMIKSEISSVRNEINAKDNYLDNAAFADNMSGWSGTSNIRIFRVSGRLLYFNNNFYANKENFAGITADGSKNVLRLKNSGITQLNADFSRHPEFDLYDITATDEIGNEIVTGQQYRPRMFYISFRYKVNRPGTLRVCFKNENPEGFEEYVPIDYSEVLNPSEEFKVMEIAGKWNGTGDFFLSFSGDMYLYSLALADNRLADMEEKFTMRFEATDKKIQANLDEIKKTGEKLEEYHSEFLLTARNLQLQFTEDLSAAESRITEAYKSYVNLTARDLTVQFQADISNAESRITEAYTSAIKLSAQGLQTKFTADITDMEAGITAAYKSYVNLTARNLQAGFTEDLADLRTGITEEYTSAIDLSARGLRADFNSSITDLNGKLTTHTSSFHVTASKIESMVSATDSISNTIRTAGWITTADGNRLWATISTVNGINNRLTTHEASFHVTATRIEGIVSDITEQGTNYSRLTQTVSGITAEVNDISGRYSSLKVQVDAIGALVGDGTEGSFSEFQQTIDRLTTQVADNKTAAAGALTAAQNAASAAANAQGKANSAYDKAVSNATAITQTNSAISAIAGRFNADGTLKEGAGWVTTAEANTSWVRKDGIISAINQTAESVTIDASRINLNGAITANRTFKIGLDGSMEATGGRIAGLKISGDSLTNEGFDNDACVILRNDSHKTFAAIGGNTLPASSGIRAVARFENEESTGYWGNTNVAMLVSAKNGTYNRAIVATGDIVCNGLNVGYAFHEFSFTSANKWLELAPVRSGIMFVYFNHADCAVVLPTLQHVCESLGVTYSTPFAVRLTVVSTAGNNGKLYGRNRIIAGTSGNQYPELRKWDGGTDDTGYDFNPHDSFEVCLFYQGGTGYIPSISNAYRAYITGILR